VGEISEALERAKADGSERPPRRRRGEHASAAEARRAAGQTEELAPPAPDAAAAAVPGATPLRAVESALIDGDHPRAELCRHLAHRVLSEMERRQAHSVAVVSPLRGEGKSTIACNLAIALASLSRGGEVALVDLDLRRPTIASKLGLSARVGVEAVLQGRAPLADARVGIEDPSFDVYPSVEAQRSAHELIVLPRFATLIGELKKRYATVVVDTPPVLLVPDANLILRHVECCIPLARAGVTRVRTYRNMVDLLPRARILGGLLNGSRAPSHARDYYYYYGEKREGDAS
jgi:protein-tyrosine kinase